MKPTPEQVKQWAREAVGRQQQRLYMPEEMVLSGESAQHFAAIAYAAGQEAEREECAQIAAKIKSSSDTNGDWHYNQAAIDIEGDIRARSKA